MSTIGPSATANAAGTDFAPTGDIAATSVQAAIAEVASERTTPAQAASAAPVQTVFGRTAAVVAATGDYTLPKITVDPARVIGGTAITSAATMLDYSWSAGLFSGFALTDNGNGTVNIASGEGVLRSSASESAPLMLVAAPAATNVSLTDGSVNYLYVDYNAGAPQIAVSTSSSAFNCQDSCVLYRASREGNEVHWIDLMHNSVDGNRKLRRRLFETSPIERATGAVVSQAGTRGLAATSGIFWAILSRVATAPINTSTGGTFDFYYESGPGTFTKVAGQTQVDNLHYATAGAWGTLSNGRYGVRWVFMSVSETGAHLLVVLGTSNATSLAAAQNESVPANLPAEARAVGVLLAQVILVKSATTFAEVRSVSDVRFVSAIATTHDNLAGIDGGAAPDFYHSDQPINQTDSPSFAGLSLTGLVEYADDAAAATGGLAVGGLYRTASAVKVRVA